MKRRNLLIAMGCAAAVGFGLSAVAPKVRGAEKAATTGKAPAQDLRFRGTVEKGGPEGTWVIKVVSSRRRTSIIEVAPDSPKAAEVAALVGKMVVATGTKVGEKGHEMLSVTEVKEVIAKK